jgi:biopolymer transport protein ExbB
MLLLSRLHSRRHWSIFALFFLVVSFFFTATSDPVQAQEPPKEAAKEKPKSSGFFKRSFYVAESLGFFAIPLGIVSIALIALVVILLLDTRLSNSIPPGFVDEFTDTVNKRKFKEAFDMARGDSSALGRVLTAGMSRLQYGLEDAREAALNMLDSIREAKNKTNVYLAVIGSAGPLLGLVGTVWGMIGAFQNLGEQGSTGGSNAASLAENISEALAVTLVGIGISLPAIFFNAFFRNRIIEVMLDTGHIADDLLTQMYHNSKKAGSPASGTTSAPTGGPPAPPPPPPPPPAR